MKKFIQALLGITFTLGLLYGLYWIFKSVSYAIFYDSMVRETIIEVVKQSALR